MILVAHWLKFNNMSCIKLDGEDIAEWCETNVECSDVTQKEYNKIEKTLIVKTKEGSV